MLCPYTWPMGLCLGMKRNNDMTSPAWPCQMLVFYSPLYLFFFFISLTVSFILSLSLSLSLSPCFSHSFSPSSFLCFSESLSSLSPFFSHSLSSFSSSSPLSLSSFPIPVPQTQAKERFAQASLQPGSNRGSYSPSLSYSEDTASTKSR